jgi:hypothetical protein
MAHLDLVQLILLVVLVVNGNLGLNFHRTIAYGTAALSGGCARKFGSVEHEWVENPPLRVAVPCIFIHEEISSTWANLE